jgi:drug/metabolite transporter (DMT)-like permease
MPSATVSAFQALRRRWATLPGPLRGTVCILLAGMAFVGSSTGVREVVQRVDPGFASLVRALLTWLMLLPFVLRDLGNLRTRWPMGHVWRGMTVAVSTWLWFWALGQLPVADVTALNFSKGLFLVALAIFVLGEPVRADRIGAAIAGFIGVMVMLRPDRMFASGHIELGQIATLGSAALAAISAILVKKQMAQERPMTVLFYYGLSGAFFSLPMAIPGFAWPSMHDWLVLLSIGLTSSIGQYLFVLAYQQAPASLLAPFEYMQLLYAVLVGLVLFGEAPGWATLAGAAIIIAANLFLTWRERRLHRA